MEDYIYDTKIFNLKPTAKEIAEAPGSQADGEAIINATIEKAKALKLLGHDGWEIKAIFNNQVFLQKRMSVTEYMLKDAIPKS